VLPDSNQNVFTTFNFTSQKGNDILLNVAVPVLIGSSIYLLKYLLILPAVIQNYCSDGLWAYAYSSVMLIIWDRKFRVFWLLTAFLSTVFFEILQRRQSIPGTGDPYDILVYAIFFALALSLNDYFKTFYFLNKIS
jgi:hypothetical protein